MFKNWVYNGKRIKIVDTKIDVPEGYETEPVFVDKEFYLAIWDKSLKIDIGSAKQLANGEYVGYIPHGMHSLMISGTTIHDLAKDAYVNYLYSLDN